MLKGLPEKELALYYEKRNKIVFFHSRFNFLKAHNGIRPGNVHGLLGTSGGGKSSLFKTIIFDTAKTQKVLVWLTEEKVIEYTHSMRSIGDIATIKEHIDFVEENNLEKEFTKSLETFYQYMEMKIVESECKVLFIDNITTGVIYGDDIGVSGQAKSARMLNELAKRLDIAIFYVAHTTSSLRDNMGVIVTSEHVRGSKQITMVSEYLYGIQKIVTPEIQRNFVNIIKHRHHQIKEKTYMLEYRDNYYVADKQVPFEKVKAIFEMRSKF